MVDWIGLRLVVEVCCGVDCFVMLLVDFLLMVRFGVCFEFCLGLY